MDIRACQVYLRLAETRHYGRAAAQSSLSPSAVSRHIQRIEQTLGQQLVERNNRSVRLTPAGQRFASYAQRVLDEWQNLRQDLAASERELRGAVTVFGSVTASYSLLAAVLPEVGQHYPGIEVKLRTGDQADGIARILDGAEDTAIIARPDKLPARVSFQPMQLTPLVFIGPVGGSALAATLDDAIRARTEPDWSRLPLVLAERGLARERLLERLRQSHIQPPVYAQVAGHEAVVSMVSLGLGVALVPRLVIDHSPKNQIVRVLPWLDDLAPFELGLCALTTRLADPVVQAFWRASEIAYPQQDSSTATQAV
jgi:LysR family positive regulator for ilvC